MTLEQAQSFILAYIRQWWSDWKLNTMMNLAERNLISVEFWSEALLLKTHPKYLDSGAQLADFAYLALGKPDWETDTATIANRRLAAILIGEIQRRAEVIHAASRS